MHEHTHEEAQAEELAFWNTPGAELGEQLKQLTYMRYLGLNFFHDGNSPFVIDKTGLNIMDVGGGPVSLLLKTNADRKVVVDPCDYPKWSIDRYKANNVNYHHRSGETLTRTNAKDSYDEVWMYNVLQHTEDPQKIFANIYKTLKKGGALRFLDWVNTPTNVAHPITLQYKDIAEMLKKAGFKVGTKDILFNEHINENGAVGEIAYGTFYK